MLGILEDILEIFENIPNYILFAIETLCNIFFAGIQAIFEVVTSLIPLPAEPGAPEYIANINWFFPIGAVVSIMVPIVTGYVAFLLIRWVYQKVGAL
jgi:hypothetical protein